MKDAGPGVAACRGWIAPRRRSCLTLPSASGSSRHEVDCWLLAQMASKTTGHERSQDENRHHAVGKADTGGVGERAEQQRRGQDGGAGGEGEPGAGLVR